ncbi:hypothetical protein M0805_007187, partial [Coniferiporia weirii]
MGYILKLTATNTTLGLKIYITCRGVPGNIKAAKDARFFKPDFDEAAQKYMDLEGNPERHTAYVANRTMMVSKVIKVQYRFSALSPLLHILPGGEGLVILSRLQELGYDKADYPREYFEGQYHEWKRLVENKIELNPRIWKTLLPKLVKIILEVREKRVRDALDGRIRERKTELRKFYIPYLKAQAPDPTEQTLLPNLADLFALPHVHARIRDNDAREEITQETWNALSAKLPEAFQNHKTRFLERCDVLCAESLPESSTEAGKEGPDPSSACGGPESAAVTDAAPIRPGQLSSRAYAFFVCGYRRCWKDRVPQPLLTLLRTHKCTVVQGNGTSIDNRTRLELNAQPWSKFSLRYASAAAHTAKILLRAMAIPESTTMERMSDCGESFACLMCTPAVRKKLSWLDLIAHFCEENDWYDRALENLKDYENYKDAKEVKEMWYEGGKPYWLTIINDHDMDKTATSLVRLDQEFDFIAAGGCKTGQSIGPNELSADEANDMVSIDQLALPNQTPEVEDEAVSGSL